MGRRRPPQADSGDEKPEETSPKVTPKTKPIARRKSKMSDRGRAGKDRRDFEARQAALLKKKEYEVIKVHTLGKKETWTHLAAKYYGNTTEPYWRHIYEFNKETVGDNYKRIFGGMEIKIPELPDELKKKDK